MGNFKTGDAGFYCHDLSDDKVEFHINFNKTDKLNSYLENICQGNEGLFKTLLLNSPRSRVEFKNLDSYVKTGDNLDVLTIEVDNKEYKVIQMAYFRADVLFSLHNINGSLELFKSIDVSEFIKNIKIIINEFNELKKEEKEITKISDGYANLFNKEIGIMINNYNEIMSDLTTLIDNKIKRDFFQYSRSTIQDLSVIDGVRCFEWDGGSYSYFHSLHYYVKEIDELFAKIFKNDKNLYETYQLIPYSFANNLEKTIWAK